MKHYIVYLERAGKKFRDTFALNAAELGMRETREDQNDILQKKIEKYFTGDRVLGYLGCTKQDFAAEKFRQKEKRGF